MKHKSEEIVGNNNTVKPVSNSEIIKYASFNRGASTLADLAQSLQNPINVTDCATLLQRLLANLPYFSEKWTNELTPLVNKVLSNLKSELVNTPYLRSSFVAWKSHFSDPGKAVADLIVNCATIVKAVPNNIEFSADEMQFMLGSLSDSTSSETISISLQGLGMLAQAGKLHGDIEAFILPIFQKLPSLNYLKSRDILNSLHGLGGLAHGGKIRGVIDTDILHALIEKSMQLDSVSVDEYHSLREAMHTLIPFENFPEHKTQVQAKLREIAYNRKISSSDLCLVTGITSSNYKGLWHQQEVAVKKIANTVPNISGQINTAFVLKHENVMNYLGYVETETTFDIVMPYMEKGSLKTFVLENQSDRACRITIAAGIAKGIAYLHSQNIIVSSFSPETILLDAQLNPKITGHTFRQYKNEGIWSVWDDSSIAGKTSLSLEQKKAANMQSLGRILLFLFTGNYPQLQADYTYELMIPADIPEKIRTIIKLCLDATSDHFPKPLDIAEHFESSIESQALPLIAPGAGYNLPMPSPKQPGLKTRQPDLQESDMITKAYGESPLENYHIANIEMLENLPLSRGFTAWCDNLQSKASSERADYRCTWANDAGAVDKQHSLQTFQGYASRYRIQQYPDLTIMPLWHGTIPEAIPSITTSGLAIRASRNGASFGCGIYLTPDAKYAGKYYASKKGDTIELIFCLVAAYSIYPVQKCDSFQGQAMNPRYDAHVIHVTDEGHEGQFEACDLGQKHQYTEFVVSQEAACYPAAKVTLRYGNVKPELINPGVTDNGKETRKKLLDYLGIYATSNVLDFGDYIISGHSDGRLKIWDTRTAVYKFWPTHQNPIVKLAVDNNHIIALDNEGHIVQEHLSGYGITSTLIVRETDITIIQKHPAVKNPQLIMVNDVKPLKQIAIQPVKIDKSDLKKGALITRDLHRYDDCAPSYQTNKASFFGTAVAIKELENRHMVDRGMAQRTIMSNLRCMSLQHPNLVSIHGFSEHSRFTSVLFPHFEKGTLEAFLARESNVIPESQKIEWMIQLAGAIGFYHDNGQTHAHLSTRSILVKDDGTLAVGACGEAGEGGSANSAGGSKGEKYSDGEVALAYRAPETFTRDYAKIPEDKRYVPSRDVYAFGQICLSLLLGKNPTDIGITPSQAVGIQQKVDGRIFSEEILLPWRKFLWSNRLITLAHNCMVFMPDWRPSMSKAVSELLEIQKLYMQSVSVLPLQSQAPKRWVQSRTFVETFPTPWPEEKYQADFLLAFQNERAFNVRKMEVIVSSSQAAAFRGHQEIQAFRMNLAGNAFRQGWLADSELFAEERKKHKQYFEQLTAISALDMLNLPGKKIPQIRPVQFWLVVDKSEINRILHGDFPVTDGPYGKGVYGSLAYEHQEGKVAILCVAIPARPFPILAQDPDLTGRRNYDNSDCHIVLSKKKSIIVMFDTKAIHPRSILELEDSGYPTHPDVKELWRELENVDFLPEYLPKSDMDKMQIVDEMQIVEEKPAIALPSPHAFFSKPPEQELLKVIELNRQFIIRIAEDNPCVLKIMNCYNAEEIRIEAHNKPITGMRMVDDETFITYSENEEKVWETTEYGPRERHHTQGLV